MSEKFSALPEEGAVTAATDRRPHAVLYSQYPNPRTRDPHRPTQHLRSPSRIPGHCTRSRSRTTTSDTILAKPQRLDQHDCSCTACCAASRVKRVGWPTRPRCSCVLSSPCPWLQTCVALRCRDSPCRATAVHQKSSDDTRRWPITCRGNPTPHANRASHKTFDSLQM